MTDVDSLTGTSTSLVEKNSNEFSWRRELFYATLMVAIICAVFFSSWNRDRDPRPLILVGMLLYMIVAFALGTRRRWFNAKHPELARSPVRFSLAELLVFATAFAVFSGFLSADLLKPQQIRREHEKLQAATAGVLGPDGQITHEPDGSLQIAICDRTFDDARLARLVEVIFQWEADTKISGVMFGSGANTKNTPPAWPGITDQSVPLLMQWQELKMLSVFGTAISQEGREQLRKLPHLDPRSRAALAR